MKFFVVATIFSLAVTGILHADPAGAIYTPGGDEFAKTWKAFYSDDAEESEINVPLTEAGQKMVPAVVEAIAHKDMRHRRYAISALGTLKDPRALDALTAILKDESEEDYFRGDAVVSIYKIDPARGTELAKEYAGQGDNLKDMAQAILTKEPWLTADATDSASPMRTCDASVYVVDPDPQGLNVRSTPRTGKVIGNLPKAKGKAGTVVHLVAENGDGWVQIDQASLTDDKVVLSKTGWVSGNMLAVSTRSSESKGVKLYEGGEASAVLATIPAETEVKVVGCDGSRLQVKYKDKVGWLNTDDQCANPLTNCR